VCAATSTLFVTGATGLVGGGVLARLLTDDPALRAYVLMRDLARWPALAARLGVHAVRVSPVVGDVRAPHVVASAVDRRRLRRDVTAVVHAAADTAFSLPLPVARRVNVAGTQHVLAMADTWPRVERVAFVSTAFVAGRLTGRVFEQDDATTVGWVNSYEQSKYEAEQLIRASARPWVILRPSTIVCHSETGRVAQFNAVHRALRLYHYGLAPMMPGTESSPVDVIPDDYVVRAIAALALRRDVDGRTFHLCAGAGSLPLGELLETTYAVWSSSAEWRRRAIPRPALASLATYHLFERTVEEAGDRRLRHVLRSLSHFAPQLALPKIFDTTLAEGALGVTAPPVRSYWARMIEHLVATNWASHARAAA
jgi:nucleoside-diphosphate-sugar epimerase